MNNFSYNGNQNLKRSNVPMEFTEEQVRELLKCKTDPVYFTKKYVKIIHIDHGVIPFDLWPYQENMYETMESGRFTIVKSPRQSGKTQAMAAYLLWFALFNDNHPLVAILANKAAQSREILDRIKKSFELLPTWMQQGIVRWNTGDIELENGARIMADSTSGSAIRGKTVALLYLDEFCFVHRNMQDEFFKSTYPTISSAKTSRLVITSTPNGFDLFYKIWTESIEGKNTFQRIEVEWDDVPGRDEAWKAETIANIGEEQFRQEFNTEFLGSSNTLLSAQTIRRLTMKDPIQENYNGCLRIYEEREPGHLYFMTVDTSRGVGIDYSAFCVFDVTETPYRVVAVYKSNIIDPLIYPEVLHTVGTQYNNAHILVEINDNGQQVADMLHWEYEYENVVFTSTRGRAGQVIGGGFSATTQRGVRTTKQVKAVGCSNVRTLIENDQLLFYDYDLIYEFSCFVKTGSSFAATQGDHDDLVMCTVLFAWATNQTFFKEMSETDVRERLMRDKEKLLFDDTLPFGIVDDGIEAAQNQEEINKSYPEFYSHDEGDNKFSW